MQETLWDIDKPLTRKDLHPHWWLNLLEPTLQPVAPWSRVQPPVLTRRRGRPKYPRRELSAFEIALSNLADKEKSNTNTNLGANTEEPLFDVAPNTSTSSSQPTPNPLFKKRQRNHPLYSDHTEEHHRMLLPIYLGLYLSLIQNLFLKNGNATLRYIPTILKNHHLMLLSIHLHLHFSQL